MRIFVWQSRKALQDTLFVVKHLVFEQLDGSVVEQVVGV